MSSASCEIEFLAEESEQEEELEIAVEDTEIYDPELAAEFSRVKSLILQEDGVSHSVETLDRASAFLRLYISGAFKTPTPDIDLGPRGSIDLHWKSATWELLINIPRDPFARASFYGDHSGSNPSSGTFDSAEFNFEIALWLMNK